MCEIVRGRPGCCANVVAFRVPVGRSAVPARCFTLAVLTLYERVRFIVTVDIGGCVKPTDSSLIGL